MLRIGLTGGIGSGKSTVARIFLTFGIPVYYADEAARAILNESDEIREKVIKRFGALAYSGKTINRDFIAARVFGNKEELDFLNAVTHPATLRDAEHWMSVQRAPYAIKEAALIFESGSEKSLDYVVGVSAPESVRIERVMKRDAISESQIRNRMNNQMDEEKKISLCNFVIVNDGLTPLLPQTEALHQHLLELAQK